MPQVLAVRFLDRWLGWNTRTRHRDRNMSGPYSYYAVATEQNNITPDTKRHTHREVGPQSYGAPNQEPAELPKSEGPSLRLHRPSRGGPLLWEV